MLTVPTRSASEVRSNAAFDALLWSLSRPGLPRELPEPGEGPVIEALLDRECRAYSADPRLLPQIMRSGAEVADLGVADHVFFGQMDGLAPLDDVPMGSDLYPDGGATVVLRGRIGRDGDVLRLSGPGVDGHLDLSVGGFPDGFWQRRTELIRYPMGFDLFVIDGATVIGLPRSTIVEVL